MRRERCYISWSWNSMIIETNPKFINICNLYCISNPTRQIKVKSSSNYSLLKWRQGFFLPRICCITHIFGHFFWKVYNKQKTICDRLSVDTFPEGFFSKWGELVPGQIVRKHSLVLLEYKWADRMALFSVPVLQNQLTAESCFINS